MKITCYAMKFVLLVILLTLLQTVAPQKTPVIKYITESQVRDFGSDITLECLVDNAKGVIVRWIKINDDRKIILTEGVFLKKTRFRFEHGHNTTTDSYTLKIINFQKEDVGTYQCAIVISLNKRASGDVQLLEKKNSTLLMFSNSVRNVVGTNIMMECNTTGASNPKITWMRDGNSTLPKKVIVIGRKLTIPNLEIEDAGNYYCFAESDIGRRNCSFNLQVQFPPIISVPQAKLYQVLNEFVDLECHVKANPEASVHWEQGDSTITNDENHRLLWFMYKPDIFHSILRLRLLQNHHFGNYSCTATNFLGSSVALIELLKGHELKPKND